MEQKQVLVLEQDVISGFSYSFSYHLLNKIKSLKKEDRIFKKGWEAAVKNSDYSSDLTEIFSTVAFQLGTQLGLCFTRSPEGIEEFISCSEEFLAIFRTTPEKPLK